MAASPQPSKRKEQMSALIEQEWSLVLTGKAASKLTDLIYNYEMDLLTNPLQKNPSLVEKYVTGLLLTGDYLELSLFLARTKDVLPL